MEMLLMGAALAMFGLAVSCLAFGAATREEPAMEQEPAMGKEAVKAAAVNARFFAAAPALPVAAAQPRSDRSVALADRKPRSPGAGGRRMLPRIPQRHRAAWQNHLPAGELT